MCDICDLGFSHTDAIVVLPNSQAMVHIWCLLLRWQERCGRN